MSATLSQALHDQALQRIVDRFCLREDLAADGGPWLPLVSQLPMAQGRIGQVRRYTGAPLSQLVSCTISVPAIGLDSHMLFAFTDTGSVIPHFTVDSVRSGEGYAFHLDLIPRLDLAVALDYMDAVFAPLTETTLRHRGTPGLAPAQIDPRQYAVMSPWMLVHRADEGAFRATFAAVERYLDQWFALFDQPLPDAGTTPAQRAARDAAHRAVLFSPEVDKVWNQITPLIGAQSVDRLITQLRTTR